MKKILFALALLATMLTSCLSEQEINYSGRGAVDVTLGVAAPELAHSRAAGANMNSGLGAIDNFTAADWAEYDIRYMLEVYDVTPGYENLDRPVKERMVQTYDEYQQTEFELRLIPNRTYKFVVWADFVKQGSKADFNYNTADLKSVARIGDVKPMDESMDAYFIQKDIAVGEKLRESLTLTRPFGKVRVIATDVNEVNFGSEPARVEATFYNHPVFVSLNALTGEAEATKETVTYSFAVAKDVPYNQGYDAEAMNQTLFADYIFAQSQANGAQEINFTMAVYGQDERLIREHDFKTQIPLGRNKLTTLIGNILTTSTEFEILIDDDFAGEYCVNPDAVQLAQPEVVATAKDNVVTLAWEAVENADYYTVSYGDVVETTTSTTIEFTLDYETEYTFEVQACTKDTMNFKSSEVCVVTVTTDVLVVKLATPSVSAVLEEYNKVVLNWTEVENADYYTVSYGNISEKVAATTVTLALDYDTEYTFAVQAHSEDTVHYLASEVATATIKTLAEPTPEPSVTEYIYLQPNSNWLIDNARFAVYTWVDGGETEWYDMVDSDGDGIYEVEKSNLKSKIIFCRMNPSATENNWNNKWNQTSDLTLPTDGNNLYTIAAGSWDNGNGTWSVYVEEEEVVGGNSDFATLSTSSSYGAQKTTNGWVGKNCAVMAGGTSDSNPVFKSMMGSDGSVKGMTMNGKTTAVGTITSPTISTGCGILKFKYGYPFSESNGIKFKVEIMQNGVVVNTYTVENKSATKLKAYEYETNVNVSGDFQIIFTNLSPSNSSSNKDRYTIWDVEWTGCK